MQNIIVYIESKEVVICLILPAIQCLIPFKFSIILPHCIYKHHCKHHSAFMNTAPCAATTRVQAQSVLPVVLEHCVYEHHPVQQQNCQCASAIFFNLLEM